MMKRIKVSSRYSNIMRINLSNLYYNLTNIIDKYVHKIGLSEVHKELKTRVFKYEKHIIYYNSALGELLSNMYLRVTIPPISKVDRNNSNCVNDIDMDRYVNEVSNNGIENYNYSDVVDFGYPI